MQRAQSRKDDELFCFLSYSIFFMTVRNSYQIVKVFNSLCFSAPLREIELAKSQSRKEKNESSLKIVEK